MKLRLFFGCLGILLFVLGTTDQRSAAAGPQGEPSLPRGAPAAPTYHGGFVTPPLPKPKFILTDTSGAPFEFWSETQSYVALLFFGYTHCPDECPLHMANIASSLQQVLTEVGKQIKVVFVTTDPARDSAPYCVPGWITSIHALSVSQVAKPPSPQPSAPHFSLRPAERRRPTKIME
jgi:protein SCO1